MDLKMPEMDGHDASKLILQKHPNVKIIILTLFDETSYILSLNKIGVKGFLSKTIEPDVLFNAIKVVYNGGFCYTPEVGKILQENIINYPDKEFFLKLSDTEQIVLQLICDGKSSSEISGYIHKSARTVEGYRQKLYDKFKVSNKEQLIVKCTKLNLV